MSVIRRPSLKIETVPVDWEMQSAMRLGHGRDAGRGLVARAQPLGQSLVELAPRGQVAARGQDDSVAPDDERSVDRRELLDRFLQPGVEDISLGLGISVERVDHELVALRQDLVAVADDEQGADRAPLAALARRARRPGSGRVRRRSA